MTIIKKRLWKVIKSELVFTNKWFKVQKDIIELPSKEHIEYFMWPEGDIVIIVPVTSDNKMIFVRQYKHAYGGEVMEFPAGVLSKNEDHLVGAKRELLEETGYTAEKWDKLAVLSDHPSKIIGRLHVFIASVLHNTGKTNFDNTENITVHTLSIPEILKKITDGDIDTSPTIACFFIALQKLSKQ